MRNHRRAVLTLGAVVLFAAAAFVTLANVGVAQPGNGLAQPAQKIGPKGPPTTEPKQPTDPTEFAHAIELPKSSEATNMLDACSDYIASAIRLKDAKDPMDVAQRNKDWETACENLQKLIMVEDNYFTKRPRKGPDGKETMTWVSVKVEADRMVGALPPEGKTVYNGMFKDDAKQMLDQAKTNGDLDLLTKVHRWYLHTDSGAEATKLLGAYNLDRGNFTAAALCYEKLLSRDDSTKLDGETLFRAAYAFERAADKSNADLCWEKLRTFQGDIQIADATKTYGELKEFVAKHGRSKNDAINFDTPMMWGPFTHSGQGKGDVPFMVEEWKFALALKQDFSVKWLGQAAEALKNKGQPMIPAAHPVTATILHNDEKRSLVVFRSHWGLHAVDMKTGKLKWETPSTFSMDRMGLDSKKNGAVTQWVNNHMAMNLRPQILVENSVVGCLSTDGTYVYAIEDLEVPPAQQFQNLYGQQPQQNFSDPAVSNAVKASVLRAFDMATGKEKWEVGGATTKDEKPELSDSYFLGAPMPLGGKLYVLTEKQQDLRLACLDPANGKLLSVQTLATARDKMDVDPWRRVQATHLAYGEGILVCPTNSGALLGVDLLSNNLVWAYPYRNKDESEYGDVWDGRYRPGKGGPPPGFQPGPDGRWYNMNINTKWKVTPPVIVDGKVVFTAPDASAIHCISLRDGGGLWKQDRAADDLYFAGVFNQRVVVVGKGYVKAYSLAKGELMWTVPTGMPSGYGTASNDVYYLPLKEAGTSKEPEICSIDVVKGRVIAHTKSHKGQPVGNLVFYDGGLLSQTTTELYAYPQVEAQLQKITEKLKVNPDDPEGLYKRGQMYLDKGRLSDAIKDLRDAMKNKPSEDLLPKVREKLYDSFTEYFQDDFTKAEEYLPEYEEMCKVAVAADADQNTKDRAKAEQQRRRGTFLCLVAKGKEAQGKLVEAFDRYRQYGEEAAGQDLISVVDEPNVRATPEVWSGGRIAAMVAKASPEDRKPLEAMVAKRWEEVKKTEDTNEIRNFVRVFGALFTVGKEARLELANRLMDDNGPTALLEAEQQLAMVRARGEDPTMAGRAVEALARLNTRKGLLEDASYYYRLLRDDYAKVTIRDGKTGLDLFNDMATDKRLLPHLDVPGHHGITGKNIKVEEQRGNYQMNQQVYEFGEQGEPLPFFQKHKISIQFNLHQLKITDRLTGEEKTKRLTQTIFQNMIYGNGQPNMPKFCYMNTGHLVVLPLGHMVFGIDPIRGEVLWERNLYADKNQNGQMPAWTGNFSVDPKDGSLVVVYQDGWMQRIGGSGSLESSVLCLHTRDALVAIDPVDKGKILWMRTSITPNSHVYNDDQYVYLVEMNSDGQPASTRVLRAYDGVTVNCPDFATQYKNRLRHAGRNILLSETDAKGKLTLRLYDVVAGKNLWAEEYAANSKLLQSEDTNYAGVVEPDGGVRVVDIRNGKEAMKTKLDPKFLDKVTAVHLLADGQYFYVGCNKPVDLGQNPWGNQVMTNLYPGTGLRALPFNGELYCFDAKTGKTKWHAPLENQMIVLDHFADMPFVLATSRYGRWVNGPNGRQPQQIVAIDAIQKSNGKFVYKPKEEQIAQMQNWQQFHSLNLDAKKGTIELINFNAKLVFTVSNDPMEKKSDPGTEKKVDPVPEKSGTPGTTVPPRPRPTPTPLPPIRPKD